MLESGEIPDSSYIFGCVMVVLAFREDTEREVG